MKKFNIGERYRVDDKWHSEYGNIIKITGLSKNTVHYKTVKAMGRKVADSSFQKGSVFSACLKRVDDTIIIYRKSNTVIATDKLTGKTAQATCMDSDTFNLADGQKLAFYRLMGTTEEKIREMLPHLFEKDETEMQEEIKAGDEVEVVNVGKTYDTYSRWKGLGKYVQNFVRFAIPTTKDRYIVLNVKEHGAK